MWIESSGQKLYIEQTGKQGPPVLFLHGFLMNGQMFQPQIDVISQSYRCFTMDFRGFGRTIWNGEQFGLYDLVADVFNVLEQLTFTEPVRVVGMSQGGYVAMRMATIKPRLISHLVFLATQSGIDTSETKSQYLETARQWRRDRSFTVNQLLPIIIGGDRAENRIKGIWDHWRAIWELVEADAIDAATRCLLDRDDISMEVGRIAQKTLVMHGEADLGIPVDCGRKLFSALPNCYGFIPVRGAAHAFNLTHSSLVNEQICRFLAT